MEPQAMFAFVTKEALKYLKTVKSEVNTKQTKAKKSRLSYKKLIIFQHCLYLTKEKHFCGGILKLVFNCFCYPYKLTKNINIAPIINNLY